MSSVAVARKEDDLPEVLINFDDTAKLVGITPDTVREYVRFGILIPVSRGQEQLLNKADVIRLFGVEKPPQVAEDPLKSLPPSDSTFATDTRLENKELDEDEVLGFDSGYPAPSTFDLLSANKRLRQEIRELKDERTWLRTRLEKLEARSEREQMLLLYESENVRTLINAQKHPSLWSKTLPLLKAPLEWLKLAPEPEKKK